MAYEAYKVFYEAVKQKSFINAAAALNITPSAVSHSIAALESNWGFSLFIRSKTGIKLTSEGENILGYVKAVLEKEDILQSEIAKINGVERGTVTIGAFSSVCLKWIPSIVRLFNEEFPNIKVNVMQGNYQAVYEWVKNGMVDIGFESLPVNGNLFETKLHKDPILCVVPKNFKPINKNYITVDEIKNNNIILQSKGYNTDTTAYIQKYKIKVQSSFFIDDDRAIMSLVENGLGISLMPELAVYGENYNIDTYPLETGESRTIGLIMRKDIIYSPAVKRMYEYINDYIDEQNLRNIYE